MSCETNPSPKILEIKALTVSFLKGSNASYLAPCTELRVSLYSVYGRPFRAIYPGLWQFRACLYFNSNNKRSYKVAFQALSWNKHRVKSQYLGALMTMAINFNNWHPQSGPRPGKTKSKKKTNTVISRVSRGKGLRQWEWGSTLCLPRDVMKRNSFKWTPRPQGQVNSSRGWRQWGPGPLESAPGTSSSQVPWLLLQMPSWAAHSPSAHG